MKGDYEYNGNYCGCCGRMCGSMDWCKDCQSHLAPIGLPHERTYLSQHCTDCPFVPKLDDPWEAWDARRKGRVSDTD